MQLRCTHELRQSAAAGVSMFAARLRAQRRSAMFHIWTSCSARRQLRGSRCYSSAQPGCCCSSSVCRKSQRRSWCRRSRCASWPRSSLRLHLLALLVCCAPNSGTADKLLCGVDVFRLAADTARCLRAVPERAPAPAGIDRRRDRALVRWRRAGPVHAARGRLHGQRPRGPGPRRVIHAGLGPVPGVPRDRRPGRHAGRSRGAHAIA